MIRMLIGCMFVVYSSALYNRELEASLTCFATIVLLWFIDYFNAMN